MSNTNLNVNGRRAKITGAYWTYLTKRQPCIGDTHVADNVHYTVTGMSADGGRVVVYVSKRILRGGRVGR